MQRLSVVVLAALVAAAVATPPPPGQKYNLLLNMGFSNANAVAINGNKTTILATVKTVSMAASTYWYAPATDLCIAGICVATAQVAVVGAPNNGETTSALLLNVTNPGAWSSDPSKPNQLSSIIHGPLPASPPSSAVTRGFALWALAAAVLATLATF